MPFSTLCFLDEGMKTLVDTLIKPIHHKQLNAPVTSLQFTQHHTPNHPQIQLIIRNDHIINTIYDTVIFATQANQASNILSTTLLSGSSHLKKKSKQENENENQQHECLVLPSLIQELNQIPYTKACVIVHSDQRYLPEKVQDWRSLNLTKFEDTSRQYWIYQSSSKLTSKEKNHHDDHNSGIVDMYNPKEIAQATHWMNYNDTSSDINSNVFTPILQTTSPLFIPSSNSKVYSISHLERAIVNLTSQKSIQKIQKEFQGKFGIWFVGSWLTQGIPLLEACVEGAVDVVKQLGVELPWEK